MLKDHGDDLKAHLVPVESKSKRRRKSETATERVFRLLRQGLKIGASLSGANMTNYDDKEKRVLSPRFFGVTADRKNDEKVGGARGSSRRRRPSSF